MLKYILSLSLLFSFVLGFAQTKDEEISLPKQSGIAVGINLAPYIIQLFEKERVGFEANARYIMSRKWQAVGELGYEHVDFDKIEIEFDPDDNSPIKKGGYQYNSDGTFLRLGFDYNFFKVNEADNNDNILVGIRYGIALQEHQSDQYIINDDYWGAYQGSLGNSSVNSHWAELVFGLRSEVLKNFYMGWSVRLKRLIAVNAEDVLQPYTVPGYGHRDNETNLTFTYTLEYQIPFKSNKK